MSSPPRGSFLVEARRQLFVADPRASENVEPAAYAAELGLGSGTPMEIGDGEDALATRWQEHAGRRLTLRCRDGIPHFLRGALWCKLMAAGTESAGMQSHKLQLEAIWIRVKEKVCPGGYVGPVPSFGDNVDFRAYPYLSEEGALGATRVLTALKHMDGVEWCPSLLQLVPVLVVVMPESCAYAVASEMFSERPLFFPVRQEESDIWCGTFCHLLLKKSPALFKSAQRCRALELKALRRIFQRMFVGVLPLRHILRVWDTWLCEGSKVLYRFGLGLLLHFKARLRSLGPGDDWWMRIGEWTRDASFDFEEVKKKSFRLTFGRMRPLTWVMIERCHARLKNSQARQGSVSDKGASAASSPPPGADPEMQSSRHYRENDIQPFFWPPFQIAAVPEPTLLKSMPFRAALVDWVPELERHKTLRTVYSTEIFGFGIETLFSHCRSIHPSLLVAESLDGAVFGAFCSDPWQPSKTVFGNGQCFLFRLKPDPAVFRWAANKRSPPPPTGHLKRLSSRGDIQGGNPPKLIREPSFGSLAHISRHGNSRHAKLHLPHLNSGHRQDGTHAGAAASESFMMATHSFIALGVSPDTGKCGLKLYNGLQQGSTGYCETFSNEPLVDKPGGEFEVSCVEVYAFA